MARTLLLLHGLGATGAVWDPMRERLPDGWAHAVAPDLEGHGAAGWTDRYSFGAYAAHAAALVDPAHELVVLGHSMGGVVALALASGWFGVQPQLAIGLGIKVSWTDGELDKALELSQRPPRTFDDRDEAARRWLRVAGLTDLVEPDHPMVRSAIVATEGGWQLAWDPRTAAVGAPPMRSLLAAAAAPVVLARGEHDGMVTAAQLRELVGEPVDLLDIGHNAHVESPDDVIGLLPT